MLPTKEEIAFNNWRLAPDGQIVRAYRRVRRWLGLGCYAIPWKDALPTFICSRSRKHSGIHVAKTPSGPIAWDTQWTMPPYEGLVCSPLKKEFNLVITTGNAGRDSAFINDWAIHTAEEHANHLEFAETLNCVAIDNDLYAARTSFLSDETAAALITKHPIK